MMSRMTILLGT